MELSFSLSLSLLQCLPLLTLINLSFLDVLTSRHLDLSISRRRLTDAVVYIYRRRESGTVTVLRYPLSAPSVIWVDIIDKACLLAGSLALYVLVFRLGAGRTSGRIRLVLVAQTPLFVVSTSSATVSRLVFLCLSNPDTIVCLDSSCFFCARAHPILFYAPNTPSSTLPNTPLTTPGLSLTAVKITPTLAAKTTLSRHKHSRPYRRGNNVATALGAVKNAISCRRGGFSSRIDQPQSRAPSVTAGPDSRYCALFVAVGAFGAGVKEAVLRISDSARMGIERRAGPSRVRPRQTP